MTGNYFQQLGVRAQLGRTLLPSDEVAPGQHPVVVLSDTLWKRYFGGDPDIVGKTIRVNAYPLTVVGVAAPSFHGTIVSFDVEVFVPIMMTPQVVRSGSVDPQKALSDTQAGLVIVMGRLRPGTSRAEASAQMAVLSAQLRRDTGHRHGRPGARSRSDLAVTVRRADLHAAGGHRAERDGRAAAADRLRQHHRPRARARHFAAR